MRSSERPRADRLRFERLPGLRAYPAGLARLHCAVCQTSTGIYCTTAEADRAGWRVLDTAAGRYVLCRWCQPPDRGSVRVIEDDGEID